MSGRPVRSIFVNSTIWLGSVAWGAGCCSFTTRNRSASSCWSRTLPSRCEPTCLALSCMPPRNAAVAPARAASRERLEEEWTKSVEGSFVRMGEPLVTGAGRVARVGVERISMSFHFSVGGTGWRFRGRGFGSGALFFLKCPQDWPPKSDSWSMLKWSWTTTIHNLKSGTR